jgi:serine/threonine protein kinase
MFLNAVHGGPPLESITAKSSDAEPWSAESLDFLRKCLTKDADARPSAEKLLEHPFLKRADTANEMKRILKLIFLSNSLQMQGIGI